MPLLIKIPYTAGHFIENEHARIVIRCHDGVWVILY